MTICVNFVIAFFIFILFCIIIFIMTCLLRRILTLNWKRIHKGTDLYNVEPPYVRFVIILIKLLLWVAIGPIIIKQVWKQT